MGFQATKQPTERIKQEICVIEPTPNKEELYSLAFEKHSVHWTCLSGGIPSVINYREILIICGRVFETIAFVHSGGIFNLP